MGVKNYLTVNFEYIKMVLWANRGNINFLALWGVDI